MYWKTEMINRLYIDMYVYTHITVNEEEGMDLKESKEDREGLKEGNGRGNGVTILKREK